MQLLITKLQSLIRDRFYHIICLLLFYYFSIHAGYAQHFQFKYVNKTLASALAETGQSYSIKMSFDASQLKQKKITKSFQANSAQEAILTLLEGSSYSLLYKHNTYLIIKPSKQSDRHYISGTVSDKESGERLPYAGLVLSSNGQLLAGSADGTFSLQLTDEERVSLKVKYMGYNTLDTIITASPELNFLDIELTPSNTQLQTVEVKSRTIEILNNYLDAGHFSFNPSQFSNLPNYGDTDIFRALQTLPGISCSENSSELSIRGSSPDQNLILLDGYTLYNVDHFFGVFSAINPYIVKDIQVYKGGFDARYGERVSSIIDITSISGNKYKPRVKGSVNLINANLSAEIPLSRKLTMVAGARRAYSDIYSSWLADEILADKLGKSTIPKFANDAIKPEFTFGDYNLKLTYNPKSDEQLIFSLYGANDKLTSTKNGNRLNLKINTTDKNKWGNYGFGFSWIKQHSKRYSSTLRVDHSGYYNDYRNETKLNHVMPLLGPTQASITRITNEENKLSDYYISWQHDYLVNQSHFFKFGLTARRYSYEFYKDATTSFIYDDLENSAILSTLFMQDNISVNGKLQVTPGLRLNYYDENGKMYLEPRLNTNYRFNNQFSLKASCGKYYQFLNKSSSEQSYGYNREFWILANDDQQPVVSANHFILGASFKQNKFLVDIEAYIKKTKGIQEYLFQDDQTKQEGPNPIERIRSLSKFITGKSTAKGIDFLIKFEDKKFTSWLAYSLSKSTLYFDQINNGQSVPSEYDKRHELKWSNILTLSKWNFSTLTLFHTGRPYIESSTKDEYFNTTRVYKNLPNYFRVDLSANYNTSIGKVKLQPGISLLNAFNTKNYLDIYTQDFHSNNEIVHEKTLIEAQKFTINFFLNFKF
ncbi:TonB-dependent receptor [Puteibacter caeruleilacunae]|nr:TonB-dependent receptor [Puteibacter caeruleilacunae]